MVAFLTDTKIISLVQLESYFDSNPAALNLGENSGD